MRFGRRVLVTVLRMLPEGVIRLPNEVELEEYVSAIAERHPTLGQERVWGAMDGLQHEGAGSYRNIRYTDTKTYK